MTRPPCFAVGVAGLVWSDELVDEARRTRDDVAAELSELGVPGELTITGATSVRGALTKGDIDLHLRVEPTTFPDAVAALARAYRVGSPHAWADTLAVFDLGRPHPAGLAVTPVDSPHDRRFRTVWDALRRHPGLLDEYNDLKRQAHDTATYEARKSEFFSAIAVQRSGG